MTAGDSLAKVIVMPDISNDSGKNFQTILSIFSSTGGVNCLWFLQKWIRIILSLTITIHPMISVSQNLFNIQCFKRWR